MQICKRAGISFEPVLDFMSQQPIIESENEVLAKPIKPTQLNTPTLTRDSSEADRIALFMSYFRGRDDVYAKGYYRMAGTSGKPRYSPALRTTWCSVCKSNVYKCKCGDKRYLPLDENVIKRHLHGKALIGIYPMVEGDSCYFLALDFDKADWRKDVTTFRRVCAEYGLEVAVEHSRSGNGAHGSFLRTKSLRELHGDLVANY